MLIFRSNNAVFSDFQCRVSGNPVQQFQLPVHPSIMVLCTS